MTSIPSDGAPRNSGWGIDPLTVYRPIRGRVTVSSSGIKFRLRPSRSIPPERTGPVVLVGREYQWREFVAFLRQLADDMEHNHLPGPADRHELHAEDDVDDGRRVD